MRVYLVEELEEGGQRPGLRNSFLNADGGGRRSRDPALPVEQQLSPWRNGPRLFQQVPGRRKPTQPRVGSSGPVRIERLVHSLPLTRENMAP